VNSKQFWGACVFCLLVIVSGCGSSSNSDQPAPTEAVNTTEPTETAVLQTFTCADIDANWGNDWQTVIATLEDLIQREQNCGDEPLLSKKYAAHFIYANSLEAAGETDQAVVNYTEALNIDANRTEALDALVRLDALPAATAVPCNASSPPLPDPAPSTEPDLTQFVTVQNDQLTLQNKLFKVRGVNYYPRQAPWHKFLQESDLAEIETELALIKEAGFNTIRIFLWYDPLFTCQPEDAIPNEVVFQKVDEIIQLAKDNDLKLIITLNDLPDLLFRPLYTDWEHYDAQTTYIVRRYRNEPAILAWDLRNEGDLDYAARPGDEEKFEEKEVIDWLAHTSELVRENDPNHLITAGWWGDPQATFKYVDILSFHHWYDATSLLERIETYSENSKKPILLEEIGYHSWQDAPQDQRSEETQANLLNEAIQITESEQIAGWLIWTAFDFEPEPGQLPTYEHFFGLWHSDLSPKPSLTQLFNQD
jgi:hypothetical protein